MKMNRFLVTTRGLAKHVDDCPLKVRKWKDKTFAHVDDCLNCKHFKDLEGQIKRRTENPTYYIYCDFPLKNKPTKVDTKEQL
jgi:hypothetical protein